MSHIYCKHGMFRNDLLQNMNLDHQTALLKNCFVFSGLLVAYLSLQEMRRVGGAKKFKWGLFYFHRFWR